MVKKFLVLASCVMSLMVCGAQVPATTQDTVEPTVVGTTAVAPEVTGLELTRDKSVQRALPLVLGLVGEKPSSALIELGNYLAKDLGYSEQCAVTIRTYKEVQKKETMQALHKEGVVLAIFVQEMGKNSFEIRLYDTTRVTMLMGKRFSFKDGCTRVWAHALADVLWPILTGQQGMFSTKIAYCKKVAGKKSSKMKHVYIAEYDGSNANLIVGTPTTNIAPRWSNDGRILYFSDFTTEFVRLSAVDVATKKRKVVSRFDGINMVPSFSQDGKMVVYCASHGKGSCQLVMYNEGKLSQLTHNTGNNVSPSFSRDGSKIYFCSDYESGQPQIYTYLVKDGSIERITDGGYCASPACSLRHEKVAYSKIIGGTMQLMLYDPVKKTHTQLTFGPGNKEECSWSPCGNYLLFSQGEGVKSAILSLHMQTKKIKVLTSSRENCSYPAWSPVFAQLPHAAA